MTRKRFTKTILLAIAYLILYVGTATWAHYQNHPKLYDVLKEFVAAGVAVPAAFMAGVFQRRNNYLIALREYWKQLIPAIQAALQYTHETTPSRVKYAAVYVQLSAAVDSTRSVFANVSTGSRSGLYPFENLKDILEIFKWLGFEQTFRGDYAIAARRCITNLWQEMYLALLREFDRDVPIQPVSKYLHTGKSLEDFLIAGTLRENQLTKDVRASHPPQPDQNTDLVPTRAAESAPLSQSETAG